MGFFDSIKDGFLKQVKPEILSKFPETTDCKTLDTQIKLLEVSRTETRKKEITESNKGKELLYKASVEVYDDLLAKKKALFINGDCARKLEDKKVKETAQIFTEEAKKYDKDVLQGSNKQSNTLLIIGGSILVVATGVILMLNKK